MNIKRMRLTREEKALEAESSMYRPVSPGKFKMITEAIARRRKDAVLNIRINSYDLAVIKEKAKKAGIPYQTMISEFLHEYANSPKI
jgi:predicted DNA binding CopG/RHH family protein